MLYPESEFTRPRPDCPHPELWSSPDTDSTESEVSELVGAFVRALKPAFVLETGTAFGYTALEIGRALRANRHGRAHSLEVDPDRVEQSQRLLEQHGVADQVRVHQISSLDYEPHRDIDFAWFDSLFELRLREFNRFYESGRLRPGAVVGFHDTGPHYPVRADVESLVASGRLRAFHLPTPRGVSFGTVS